MNLRDLLSIYPGVRLVPKSESALMRFLGAVLLFNPDFDQYVTTLGSTIYVPRPMDPDSEDLGDNLTIAHELVHVCDGIAWPVLYPLGYLFPQVLAAIPLLSLLVVPFVAKGLYGFASLGAVALLALVAVLANKVRALSAVFFYAAVAAAVAGAILSEPVAGLALTGAALVMLAPWPSPSRAAWEYRAYTMSLAVYYWATGEVLGSHVARIGSQFTGPAYYWMFPGFDAEAFGAAARLDLVHRWPGPFPAVHRLLGSPRA